MPPFRALSGRSALGLAGYTALLLDDFFRLFHFFRIILPTVSAELKFLLNREAVADNTQKESPYLVRSGGPARSPALPEMPRSAGISGRAG